MTRFRWSPDVTPWWPVASGAMTVTMWLALVLQFASVVLLRMFLGKTWLRRPGAVLVLASVVYDGVSQVLLSFPSVAQWDIFRQGIQQSFIGEADLVMSAGMLAFTVAYLATCGPRREVAPLPGDAELAARVLEWRILALACLPLAVLTYEGRGYNGTLTTGAGAPLASSLAAEFFLILVILAAFSFLLRHGTAWLVPVLAVQSGLLAAAGERTPVLVAGAALMLLLARTGRGPSRRQGAACAALTLAALLAITGLRAQHGRAVFYADSGLATRVTALGGGITSLAPAPGADVPGLAAQLAARLDGTAFAAGILQAEAAGQPRLSASYVPESLLLAVPSAAWVGKPGAALDPARAENGDFGLQHVNFLPALPGLYAGFLAWPWLIGFLAALGLAAGRAERWLLRRVTPARLVLLTGAAQAVLGYEGGLPAMLVALRAAAVIAAIMWTVGQVRWHPGSRQAPGREPLAAVGPGRTT